jgi:hypothetical protein
MEFRDFKHFWEDQSENMPHATRAERAILLIAKGWAITSWEVVTRKVEKTVRAWFLETDDLTERERKILHSILESINGKQSCSTCERSKNCYWSRLNMPCERYAKQKETLSIEADL